MPDEWKTPEKPWLKRLYGDTISPREVILTAMVAMLLVALLS